MLLGGAFEAHRAVIKVFCFGFAVHSGDLVEISMAKQWLHLGLGSFHRAHQACYFNHLLEAGAADDWTFSAGNIRNDAEATVQGMLKQGCKYTLETISPAGERHFETVKAITKLFPFEPELKDLIAFASSPDTKVISFTVTEAGYYLNSMNHLNLENDAVLEEIKGGMNTIYGVIAAMLRARVKQDTGDKHLTLLCCDNVRENGKKFRQALREFFEHQHDEATLAFLDEYVSTPNTMVDRITPRPEPTLGAEIKEFTGVEDLAPVMSEAFIQWVIEDNFAAGRPALEKVGVQFVESVLPYEDAKLRILNASHSCLAWAGTLKNHKLVYECARDPELYQFAFDYVTKTVIPCLEAKKCPINLAEYRDTTLDRFRNDHLRDGLERIAQDSFSKFYTFVKPTLLDCYKEQVDPSSVIFLAAEYFVFLEELFVKNKLFDYLDRSFDKSWWDKVQAASDPVLAYANTYLLFNDLAKTQPNFVTTLRVQVERVRALRQAH